MREEEKGGNSKKKKGSNSSPKPTKTKRTKKAVGDSKAERESEAEEVITQEGQDSSFYIAGICASAGGLEAYEKFFKNMPPDSGIAFILVPHLDPTHKSMMVDLINRGTKMKAFEAKDGMQVVPNNIYIIPPNKNLSLFHGNLQLIETREPRGQRHPIDYFLRALAEDQGEKAIGIILSGTGTDGTAGLKSIKEAGGMVMVQDPATAKYDGMPRSAIDTDLADYILPPENMPEKLIKYVKHVEEKAGKTEVKEVESAKKVPDSLQKVFILLRSHTGNDFSLYKKSTVMRRIERRMSIHQIDKLSDYARLLQDNHHEIDMLFKELLIGVTNFFRDPEAFGVLKTKVLPYLFKEKRDYDSIRVWTVGCSTGEEAYSIAIVFREYIEAEALGVKVQIFATDIDDDAIETARAGVYPDSIAVDVSPERLRRYFIKEGDTYHVDKRIRESIVFAIHNVVKDPPFSKLDMISCRNLLIYLDTELQKKILPLFHYALKPEGILFLGTSETIGTFVDLFDVFDKKWKFYKRKESILPQLPVIEFQNITAATGTVETQSLDLRNKKQETAKLTEVIEKILLESYAPPCVIVNQKGDILYVSGRTGKYLEPAPGEARMNILEMAREGLKSQVQFALRNCISKGSEVVIKDVQIKIDGAFQTINLSVKPVRPIYKENLMMVLFEDVKSDEDVKKSKTATGEDRSFKKRIQELEQELKHTKENLQTTIEELETANEELKSTNEELQSANEELQSTNEELETAKEETQSLNEELVTVNSELQGKIDELVQTNNDMKNLLDSTQIATIFLDKDFKVKRFTPEASKIINLIDSDIGRSINHITTTLSYDNLVDDMKQVFKTLINIEREIQTKDGHWYIMRIIPYRTLLNYIDGIILTFVDIHEQRKTRT
ncbi:MAG TPA: CheR family methyltransferase, partial [Thermodesulfobacteriota bacterium]|nr:CheR family methyltransferase [Thermodesulfobacteriota bacterium]